MANGQFVSYLRVSTDKQGEAGLGIEAQRALVARHLNGGNWSIIKEFVEVESGRNSDRPVLKQALALARLHRVPLLVANVSRLTRSSAFLNVLLDSKVVVHFCDIPDVDGPIGRFMLQQMANVAELEAGLISTRTSAALQAAKARGKTLGGWRGHAISDHARAAAKQALNAKTATRAADLAPVIGELRAEGKTTLAAMAKALTERGIPTASGKGAWSATQVQRVLARLEG
jgi:DNA invertase Pin-like site-specific DNA recombinase